MKKVLYFLSKTDPDLVRKCPAYTQSLQLSMGFFVIMTGIMALISGSFAISNMFVHENSIGRPEITNFGWFCSVTTGAIYASFIMAIDREIVSATTKWAVIFRLPLAFIVAIVVSLPVELKLFEGQLNKYLQSDHKSSSDGLKKELW